METVDCIVVGAGVIGLAVARALARIGIETVIIESADAIGTETSSRNSEVIHAGIYYKQNSLKARLCVSGKHALYEYCEERTVPHARCGKLIVATKHEQITQLNQIARTGGDNGINDLRMLTGEEARGLEPSLRCVAALHSPSTGIVDSHALMLNYLGDAEAAGAVLALATVVAGGRIDRRSGKIEVMTTGAEPLQLKTRLLVNAAGLNAWDVARSLVGFDERFIPARHLAKGNYFVLSTRSPFSRLIYPIPEEGGLGIHLTLDLNGCARFGPDVEWVTAKDYAVSPWRAPRFYDAIRSYWPDLDDGALQPGYTGIRPKISDQRGKPSDFLIQGPIEHGCPGLINLFGIESPA